MNQSTSAALDDEVSYSELFALFDNAQDYFVGTHDRAFDDLLSQANQLSTKVAKFGTRHVQLKQKYLTELCSLEKSLADVSMQNELRRKQCGDQEQLCADLENTIAGYRAAAKELDKQLTEVSKENMMVEFERSGALRSVAKRCLNRLYSKLSLKTDDLFQLSESFKEGGDGRSMEEIL